MTRPASSRPQLTGPIARRNEQRRQALEHQGNHPFSDEEKRELFERIHDENFFQDLKRLRDLEKTIRDFQKECICLIRELYPEEILPVAFRRQIPKRHGILSDEAYESDQSRLQKDIENRVVLIARFKRLIRRIEARIVLRELKKGRKDRGAGAVKMPDHPDKTQARLQEFRRLRRLSWKDISIKCTSDHHVIYKAKGIERRFEYCDLPGFFNKKTRFAEPNANWAFLQFLAAHGGRIICPDISKPRVKEKVSRLRRVLMKHFGLNSSPISALHKRDKLWMTRFRVVSSRPTEDQQRLRGIFPTS